MKGCFCWACELDRRFIARRRRLLRAMFPDSAWSLRDQVRSVERILADFGADV